MAKATVKYMGVIRPIESITLTLNHDELLVLITILKRIGGCPDNSPRKHATSILIAINDGVDPEIRDYDKVRELVGNNLHSGSIYFEDYK